MNRILSVLIPAVLVAGLGGASVEARTWLIAPDGTGEAPTIQAGIDSSANGDVVLLSPGTYAGEGNRDVDFNGKAVMVQSSAGSGVTTIDCAGAGRAFLFTKGESATSVISGVRVANGSHALYGGAVYCVAASPTIEDCRFYGSHAGIRGGAIYCDASAAALRRNTFENNDASYGGAIWCGGTSTASIVENLFLSNDAAISGGAVACRASSPSIEGNDFDSNKADSEGGAIYCEQSSAPLISGNKFYGNTAGANGGAVGLLGSSPTIEENLFRANEAMLGGGVYCNDFSVGAIRRNTFDQNRALLDAGAAICCTNFSAAPISNNIIVNSAQGTPIETKNDSVPTISCVCLFNNAGGDVLPPGSINGGGNFSLDPEFCGVDGSGNYFLQSDSPCAPGNTPAAEDCGLVGRYTVNCGTTAVKEKSWGAFKGLYRGR